MIELDEQSPVTTEPQVKSTDINKWLLVFISACLGAFLVACFYPPATSEVRGEIREVMATFCTALGLAGAAYAAKKIGG